MLYYWIRSPGGYLSHSGHPPDKIYRMFHLACRSSVPSYFCAIVIQLCLSQAGLIKDSVNEILK
jgi:hypothetical protein